MYLFSHLATTINVAMINIKKANNYVPDQYKLRMIINGSVSIEENSEKFILKKDDIILLHPHVIYKLDSITDNTVLDISIPVDLLRDTLRQGYNIVCNSAIGRKNDYLQLQNIITDILVYYNKEDNHLKMCSLIYSLMDSINDNFLVKRKAEGNNPNDFNLTQRIEKITSYINTNYPLPLNLQTLADHMYLTPQYLSKYIKENLGMNFNKYLNMIRMEHAREELRETNHSIITIAFNNGFASTTSFNKTFKEMFNVTPSAYRQAILSSAATPDLDHATDKNESINSILSLVELSNSMDHTIHKFRIDTLKRAILKTPWLKIMNVGLARNILSNDFHKVFLECKDKLNFEYARFENIFSERIISRIPNSTAFNFTNFDDIMSFLVECKVYPLIELGNKPEKIFYIEDSVTELNKDALLHDEILRYTETLDALLKHSVNRYGIDYVSHWKFELWIPQDENLNLLITPNEYIKGYLAYSNTIHKYLPSVTVGGPGFNASGDIENFISIMKEFNKKGILPGFISTYLFPYEPNTYNKASDLPGYRILSPDANRFQKMLAQIKSIISQFFSEPIPLYVTVYNSNVSSEIFVANSAFQAAFICKNALDLLSETDALGYYVLTDISNEYATAQPKVIAGIGLIDIYGIKKPSYYALDFLARLGNNLINQGPNYIMTSSHDNKFQILAYNYVHYNKYFCINCRENIDYQNTYSVFEQGEEITMQFELTNLPPGRYKIRKYILNRKNGSFLDEFIKILEQGNSTPEELIYMMLNMQISEVDYYKSICIPRQEIFYTDCDNSLDVSITLEPHEVNYISISRKL